jgi:signal peptidase I
MGRNAGGSSVVPVGVSPFLRRRRLLRELASLLAMIAVILVARASFADHYVVPSGSMEPTVAVGDQVCVAKAAYGLRVPLANAYAIRAEGPARGDVVVLTSPVDGQVLLKRVMAVPGDMVAVTGGRVSIDGVQAPVEERDGGLVETVGGRAHALGGEYGGGPDFGPTLVPEDKVLVLGDNRGNSADGRYFGWVDRDAILGRAVAICAHDGRPTWKEL